ncbi:MAG TPA: hypothetical protein VGO68_08730 [Pyrinomonadaceae bacterium]|jgi:hypothetical protein|nr:hypothetical protein [Pyrinomonadaceae bacterium]
MRRLRFDLSALRARQFIILARQKHFSRRHFLGLTGTAALGAATQVKNLGHGLVRPMEIQGDENRLAFLLDGEERWVIDPQRFSGTPKLTIDRTAATLRFQLSGATYPGTQLSADLSCQLVRTGGHWRMQLRMEFGDFEAAVPFEKWLAGDEAATAAVRLDGSICELGQAGRLVTNGPARARFTPQWVTELHGTRLARVPGLDQKVVSDSLTIALLDPADASYLDQPAAKRTLVSLERGDHDWSQWSIADAGALPPGAQLKVNGSPFDAIYIEAGETRNGALVQALVAEPSEDDSRLSFQPAGNFRGVLGEEFSLPLRSAMLALTFDQQHEHRVLLAQFDREPVYLQSQKYVVELGDTPGETPFALASLDGRFTGLHCAPSLLSAAIQMEGAAVQPSPCPAGSRLVFDTELGSYAVFESSGDPQRPTPTPTPRRILPIPGAMVRPTPTPTPRPTPRPTPPPGSTVPGGPGATATPRPTPRPTPPPGSTVPGGPGATPTPRPTPRPTPPPSTVPGGPGASPTPTPRPPRPPRPTPTPTPGIIIGPLVIPTPRPRPTPTPPDDLVQPTPSPTPPDGIISVPGDLHLRGRFSTVVLRPEDLLVLRLEFINFMLETASPTPQLLRDDSGKPSYIAVHLQPQNIAEQAFFESAGSKYPSDPPEQGGEPKDDPYGPPVKARIAGPSRLVFRVPSNSEPIPYTLKSILEKCGQYVMSVVPHALPPKQANDSPAISNKLVVNTAIDKTNIKAVRMAGALQVIQQSRINLAAITPGKNMFALQKENLAIQQNNAANAGMMARPPKPRAPGDSETALELPYLLILSPSVFGAWAHAQLPVTSKKAKRTELWHTRLGVRSAGGVNETNQTLRTVRAVWALDNGFHDEWASPPPHANEPFRMTLDADDRYNIVHLSSNYTIMRPATGNKPRQSYEPNPVEVERLMLSSMGAWINSRGVWDPPNPLTVEEWRQRGTMGRDHYVRVVYKGYLFPFGHRASLVKVTERKFHTNMPGNTAYLRQRMYIIVREPEKTYGGTELKTPDGNSYDRQMPFRRVRITTLVTPNLDDPANSDIEIFGAAQLQSLFWPKVLNKDFQFHLIAEDFEGNETEFTMPLLFADQAAAKEDLKMKPAKADFENTGPVERRKREMRGQSVMLADSAKPGDTTFETQTITFGAEIPTDAEMNQLPDDSPQFYPAVRRAELIIPSLKHIAGDHKTGEIKFADAYLKHGLNDDSKNNGELFGEFINSIDLNFSGKGDKSGALVTPSMKVSGLSRTMGPVAGDAASGDLDKVAKGQFDPEKFFAGLSPKLFGCIDLFEIIGGLPAGSIGKNLGAVPKFITEALSNIESFLVEVHNFRSSLEAVKATGGGGLGPTINSLINDAKTIVDTDMPDILKPPFDSIDTKLAKLSSDLDTFSNHFTTLNTGLAGADIAAAAKHELQKNVANFNEFLKDGAAFINDVKAFAGAIPLELPKEIKVRFDWKPVVKSWGFDAAHPLFVAKNLLNNKPCTLLIGVEARVKTDGKSSPSASVICSLDNFTLDLIAPASFIQLHFEKIQFLAGTGKKADVNVVIAGITFVGVLSFVEALKSLIPLDGFSDPPAIDVDASGIHASFSLALPNLAIGIFSLQNMSLGAGFTIPFIGDPLSVYFSFCSRESPFLLTVSFLGGGGFFGITIDPQGVQLLEAAFEFGASLSMDIGVASGGVHVIAGIYIRIEREDGSLTGYLRIGGEMSILGIISVSIELKMELTYEFGSGKVIGRATLTIEVEIFFFSFSVELTCERKFKGSAGDPSFADLMAPFQLNGANVKPWDEYCMAFAA